MSVFDRSMKNTGVTDTSNIFNNEVQDLKGANTYPFIFLLKFYHTCGLSIMQGRYQDRARNMCLLIILLNLKNNYLLD